MAQGKLKVKSKVPANVAKRNQLKTKSAAIHKATTKKTHFKAVKKAKKLGAQLSAKLLKDVQKKINANIEAELSAKAERVEEGKSFLTLNPEAARRKQNKNKK
jgi:hypothetical protein